MPCNFVNVPVIYPEGEEAAHPLSGSTRGFDQSMSAGRSRYSSTFGAAAYSASQAATLARVARREVARHGMLSAEAGADVAGPPRWPIALTRYPRSVSSADSDELRNALDVSSFDELDVLLHVLAFGTGTADFTLAIDTAMQTESDDAWVTVATYTAVTSAPSYELVNVTGILRYVRFRVDSIDTAAATFTLSGMGRRRGQP